MVNLHHKISALHVMWVRRLVENVDHPSTFFFRHSLRVAFAGRSLEQVLLVAPSQTALNLLPSFYRSVMVSWLALSRRLEHGIIHVGQSDVSSHPILSLSVRFLYDQFSRMDRIEHRCVSRYRSWGLDVEWSMVWSNLHLWRFIRPVRDTNWLIVHRILHTADRLVRFGITVDPLYHCGAAELLVHLFTQCPVARQIFALYQSLVKRAVSLTTQPSPSQLLVGYGRSMSIPPPLFPVCLALLGIVCGLPGTDFASIGHRCSTRRFWHP